MLDLIANIKSKVPKYVRISRVLRDIPAKFIVGGLRDSLRDPMKIRMEQMGLRCRCIRCREYGFRLRDKQQIGEPGLTRLDYEASHGTEIFLSYEDTQETLFGLLRLRIQAKPFINLRENISSDAAMVRELHVFGPEMVLSQRDVRAVQHKGFGKSLIKEAERITSEEFHKGWIAILSGVGAREYYRTEGYELKGNYMIKKLIRT
jgi:elongator complex protein 3